MAICSLIETAGMTQEQYDQVRTELNPQNRLEAGQVFHLAGPTEGGWRVVDVWQSQDAANRFRNEKLMPALQRMGVTPGQPKVIQARNIMKE